MWMYIYNELIEYMALIWIFYLIPHHSILFDLTKPSSVKDEGIISIMKEVII